VLDVVRREALSVRELGAVVDLLLTAPGEEQQRFILEAPREALEQALSAPVAGRDPRLSAAGALVWKRLATVLEMLGQLDGWLSVLSRAGLTTRARLVLGPRLERLAREANSVAVQCSEVLGEWQG
jgi:hypothetical protein